MESLPYISNPASAGLQLAAGSFNSTSQISSPEDARLPAHRAYSRVFIYLKVSWTVNEVNPIFRMLALFHVFDIALNQLLRIEL
jgi:hypothetical protein